MFSATVAGRMIGCCKTRPICALRSSRRSSRTSTPSSSTAPLAGSKNRGKRFSTVVLPAPLGPMMAADVPAMSLKLTWWSAGRGGGRPDRDEHVLGGRRQCRLAIDFESPDDRSCPGPVLHIFGCVQDLEYPPCTGSRAGQGRADL